MHQLIYTSEARPGLSEDDVSRIVQQACRNNPSGDITGFLVFQQGRFLQLIEGPLMALEMLMAQLAQDDRHSQLRILSRLAIAERSFPAWRMRRVGVESDARDELERSLRSGGRRQGLPRVVGDFLRAAVDA